MKIIIHFDKFEVDSKSAEIIKEWIQELIDDKTKDNLSLLRYADRMEIE